MTCPLIDEESRLFSEKRGLHRMFSLGTRVKTTREEKDQKWLRCVTRIHDSSHDMTTTRKPYQTEAATVTDKGKCLTFFLFGKLSKPIMMGDGNRRGAAEYVQSYSSSKGG